MKYCRYSRDMDSSNCPGCEHGCLERQPAAYINREFDDAVREMIGNGRCTGNQETKSQKS